jgi:ABC-type Zn2+ transport system substrate-binding protein/surface adhesin
MKKSFSIVSLVAVSFLLAAASVSLVACGGSEQDAAETVGTSSNGGDNDDHDHGHGDKKDDDHDHDHDDKKDD